MNCLQKAGGSSPIFVNLNHLKNLNLVKMISGFLDTFSFFTQTVLIFLFFCACTELQKVSDKIKDFFCRLKLKLNPQQRGI